MLAKIHLLRNSQLPRHPPPPSRHNNIMLQPSTLINNPLLNLLIKPHNLLHLIKRRVQRRRAADAGEADGLVEEGTEVGIGEIVFAGFYYGVLVVFDAVAESAAGRGETGRERRANERPALMI